MKLNLTRALIVLLAVVLTYSACKKSENKPTTTATQANPDAVAKQIALSLYKSLTGQMGGTNINDGIKQPASISQNRSGKMLNSVNSLCGYTLDTAYSSYTTAGDTDLWMSTKFIFTNTCSKNKVNGYSAYDSVKTEVKNATFINSYINVQQYIVTGANSTFTLVSCKGNITTSISNTIYPAGTSIGEYHTMDCVYYLSGLKIDLSGATGDITAGTATYKSSTDDITDATGGAGVKAAYTGNIIFLGNHTAKLTIDPKHYYMINFLTQTITPL